MNQVLTFDSSTHTYTIGGKNVPSVTEIVGLLTAQRYDSGTNQAVMRQAAQRGTLVHECTELIDYGIPLDEIEIVPEIAPYVQAYMNFLRDYSPQWLLIESPVSDAAAGYAGTLDRLGVIDDSLTIVDIKTGSDVSRISKIKWAVQTEGYREALPEQFRQARRKILLLRNTGKYTFYDAHSFEEKYNFDSELLFNRLLSLTRHIGGNV